MKKFIVLLSCVAFLLVTAGTVLAADNDSHQVTVTVSAINEVAIDGGNVTLTINDETLQATDSTTADLDWATNGSAMVITVETDNVAPVYDLYVTAANVTGGTATAERAITTTAQNVVTAITQTAGGCDLSYRATAAITDAPGSDVHNVTYTITTGI
ncbi:MAG: hypothetical protein KKF30_10815 [Proteobacteria bacterium]|nr:hypothetical protein [Pseudomonadota bacterium]MBU4470852.1 hypothetical protein [Pseudomonadota bacterium]MCG2753772.1 hypothetical protein [Desulfobacteraceae bacterium]